MNMQDAWGDMGVLTVALNDTLSHMQRLRNLVQDNVVGCYYHSNMLGEKRHYVYLLDSCTGERSLWLEDNSLSALLASPRVYRLTFHPLAREEQDRALFVAALVGLRAEKRRGEESGYSTVNRFLLSMCGEKGDPLRDRLGSYPILLPPLVKIVGKLYRPALQEEETVAEFLSSSASTSYPEEALCMHLCNALDTGTLDLSPLLRSVNRVNQLRRRDGQSEIALPTHLPPTLQVLEGSVGYSRNPEELRLPVREMGELLSPLLEQLGRSGEPLLVGLDALVGSYNQLARAVGLEELSLGPEPVSHAAVLYSGAQASLVPSRLLPMYGGRLDHLSERELKDILRYIDSLPTYGEGFRQLQYRITELLTQRT